MVPDIIQEFVGVEGFEGVARQPAAACEPVDGGAVTPEDEAFRSEASSEEIRDAMLKLVQKEAMILSQIAGCHRLHAAEERLTRWLLMAQDQTQTDDLHFTQALLANMLGARRATVTEIAGSLQRKKLIEYHRGHVIIRDRDGLEHAACPCYQVIKDLRGDLYLMS